MVGERVAFAGCFQTGGPVVGRDLREVQTVEFAQAGVSDWLYAVKGKAEGAFTDPRMRPR